MIAGLVLIGIIAQQVGAKSIVQNFWKAGACSGKPDYRERIQAGVCYPDPTNTDNPFGYTKVTVSASTWTTMYSSSPTCDTVERQNGNEPCESNSCGCDPDVGVCGAPYICSDEDLSPDLEYKSLSVADYADDECATSDVTYTVFTEENSGCNSPDLPPGSVGGASNGYVGIFYYLEPCDEPGAMPWYVEEFLCGGECFFGVQVTCNSGTGITPAPFLSAVFILLLVISVFF